MDSFDGDFAKASACQGYHQESVEISKIERLNAITWHTAKRLQDCACWSPSLRSSHVA